MGRVCDSRTFSTKINKPAFIRLGAIEVIRSFIADGGMSDADAQAFERRGIKVLVAR